LTIPEDGTLLRIHIGESNRIAGRPLYEAIVLEARKRGLAGATVLRGSMGFGANSLIHTSKLLRLSGDLPVVVEIVDAAEKIESFLPVLDEMLEDGLVTLERVRVLRYRAHSKHAQS